MTDAEAYIALNMVPKIGPIRVRRLLEAIGSPVGVLSANKDSLLSVQGIGPDTAESIRS